MGNQEKIGLQAAFETAAFQAGLKVYNKGLEAAKQATSAVAGAITSSFSKLGGVISNAFGMVGKLTAIGVGALGIGGGVGIATAIPTAIGVLLQYHDAINQVNESLHVGVQRSAEYVFSAKSLGVNLGTMTGAFATLESTIRSTTYEQQDAFRGLSLSMRDINYNTKIQQRDFAESLVEFDKQIRRSAEDRNISIQRSMYDYQVSLARFDRDAKESLRGVRGRERVILKRQLAEQRSDMILAKQREDQDREIAYKREQEDQARQYMLLNRGFQESMFLVKQSIQDMMNAFNISQGRNEALKGLNALGVNLSDLSTDSLKTEAGLIKISKAFKALPDDATRARTALALFGTSDTKFIDFLMNYETSLAKSKELMKTFGVTFDKASIDAYTQSVGNLQSIFDIVGIRLAQNLTPAIADFNTGLTKFLTAILPEIEKLLGQLAAAFKEKGFQGVLDVLGQWVESHQAQIQSTLQALGDALGEAFKIIMSAAQWVGGVMGILIDKLRLWISSDDGQSRIRNLTQWLGQAVADGLVLFVRTSVAIAQFMSEIAIQAIGWMVSDDGRAFFSAMARSFIDGFVAAIQADNPAVSLMESLFPPSQFPWVWNSPSTSNLPTKQKGGFQSRTEPVLLHAGEWVLNPLQTQMMMPMLASLSGGNTINNYSFNHEWSGNASAFDKNSIERIVKEATFESIGKVFGK